MVDSSNWHTIKEPNSIATRHNLNREKQMIAWTSGHGSLANEKNQTRQVKKTKFRFMFIIPSLQKTRCRPHVLRLAQLLPENLPHLIYITNTQHKIDLHLTVITMGCGVSMFLCQLVPGSHCDHCILLNFGAQNNFVNSWKWTITFNGLWF